VKSATVTPLELKKCLVIPLEVVGPVLLVCFVSVKTESKDAIVRLASKAIGISTSTILLAVKNVTATNLEQLVELVYVTVIKETVFANLLCLSDSATHVWMELTICRTTISLDVKIVSVITEEPWTMFVTKTRVSVAVALVSKAGDVIGHSCITSSLLFISICMKWRADALNLEELFVMLLIRTSSLTSHGVVMPSFHDSRKKFLLMWTSGSQACTV